MTPDWVAERELRDVSPQDPEARLAATTRKAAGRFGLTRELATAAPYELSRLWAAAFRAHAFRGIRHVLRHDPRARPSGISLFGPAGEGFGADGRSLRLDAAVVEAAGVRVLEPPHSRVLRVI